MLGIVPSKPPTSAESTRKFKHRVRQYFEFASDEYDSGRHRSLSFRMQMDFALRHLDRAQGNVTVLDLGCGTGTAAARLRRRGFTVVGVDYAEKMVSRARRRFAVDPQVMLARSDGESLPFGNETFDHVVCLGVLEYVPAHERLIGEIARVVKPAGKVIVSAPTSTSPHHLLSTAADRLAAPPWRAARRLFGRPQRQGRNPEHQRNLCSPWRLRQLLAQQGLRPGESEYSNFAMYPLDRLYPSFNDRLAFYLAQFASSPMVSWLGCQYSVVAQRG